MISVICAICGCRYFPGAGGCPQCLGVVEERGRSSQVLAASDAVTVSEVCVGRGNRPRAKVGEDGVTVTGAARSGGFDRVGYQREYMRRRRAKLRERVADG